MRARAEPNLPPNLLVLFVAFAKMSRVGAAAGPCRRCITRAMCLPMALLTYSVRRLLNCPISPRTLLLTGVVAVLAPATRMHPLRLLLAGGILGFAGVV
ncbi:hypothetical protein [Bradyrhizobium liaoningense]|uniref:hypothetical protein n=1 Tax=Bradyrhizobium liaoningense TaxID=43992 RepID=UPI0020132288|nr:hypothetical protein [Bradyrhizobium liaoningense]